MLHHVRCDVGSKTGHFKAQVVTCIRGGKYHGQGVGGMLRPVIACWVS